MFSSRTQFVLCRPAAGEGSDSSKPKRTKKLKNRFSNVGEIDIEAMIEPFPFRYHRDSHAVRDNMWKLIHFSFYRGMINSVTPLSQTLEISILVGGQYGAHTHAVIAH